MSRLLFALLLFFLSGCGISMGGTRSRSDDLVHRVTYSGETLGRIAAWYTGSAQNWKAIKSYNPGLDVYRIRIGQTIRIPRSLIVREGKLPRPRGGGGGIGPIGKNPEYDEPLDIEAGPPGPHDELEPYYDIGSEEEPRSEQPGVRPPPAHKTPEIIPDLGIEDEPNGKTEEDYSNEILEELLKKDEPQ